MPFCLDVMACNERPCMNGALCTANLQNSTDYLCQCLPGFDGKNCEGWYKVQSLLIFRLITNSIGLIIQFATY